MMVLPLITLLVGCNQPAPTSDYSTFTPAYVDVVTSKMDQNVVGLTEVKSAVKENTEVLLAIKALVESNAGGVEPQKTPSSDESSPPPAPPLKEEPVKPTLYVSTIKFCDPCNRLKKDIEDGKFSYFTVVYLHDDTWTQGYPVIRWKEDGKWMYFTREGKTKNRGYDKNVLRDLKQRFGIKQATYSRPNLIELHNELHGGGSWTWSGDLATHLREVHGVDL